jgi:putative flavoprotein involved in K+ transport
MQSQKVEIPLEVIIIGAGPAGLSLSYNLKKMGVAHIVLEAQQIGDSWKRMPDFLRLVSPYRTNLLGNDRSWNFSRPGTSASDYADYLSEFAHRNSLPVLEMHEVTGLKYDLTDWEVTVDQKMFRAASVVICLGHYGRPIVPAGVISKDAMKPTIPMTHYCNLNSEFFKQQFKKVLVVGKRLSAGQIIEMFHLSQSKAEVLISARSSVHFSKEGLISGIFFFFMNEIEWLINLILKILGKELSKIDVKMTTPIARKLIQAGKVKILPELISVEKKEAHFSNGHHETIDAIIWATGFAELWKLKLKDWGLFTHSEPQLQQFSIVGQKNLFVLGTESLVDFRSRFIRGMVQDAKKLAAQLKKADF